MTYVFQDWAVAAEVVGVLGFLSYVATYSALTLRWIDSRGTTYFLCNLCSASLVLSGLTASFNLASALIHCFWICISIVAVVLRIVRPSKGVGATPA